MHELAAVAGPIRPSADDPPVVEGKQPSAVLVPVFPSLTGPQVLFTRRAWQLRSHPGQLSFPGGRREPNDADLVETALRETEEEIGLDRSAVTVVGELDRLTTRASPANIVPVLGLLQGQPEGLVPSPHEVDGIVCVPVAELVRPDIFREELWFGDSYEGGIPITFFELESDTLWGATARIVRTMFEAVASNRKTTLP